MILWNAINNYFISPNDTAKAIAAVILVTLFCARRFGILERIGAWAGKVPKHYWLVSAIVIGFVLRLIWIIYSPYSPPAAATEDEIMIRHANELASGAGYVTKQGAFTADRPIGYALLLAALFKAIGENLDAVAFINALLAVATLGLVYRIGSQVKNAAVGIFAAFLLACYPTSVFATRIVLEEHVFIPLWLGGIGFLIADLRYPRTYKWVAAGVFFALASLIRPFSCLMGGVAFLLWSLVQKRWGAALLRAVLIQAIILIAAVPWALRNQRVLGEPILYTTWVGAALYMSNNEISDVRYPINPTVEQGGDLAFAGAETELERHHAGLNAAWRWIKGHPVIFIQKALGRVVYMLGLSREGWTVKDNFHTLREGRKRQPDKLVAFFDRIDNDYYGIIFLLALGGALIFIFRRKKELQEKGIWCLFFTVAYYLSIIALTLGHRKWRFVLEPLFCILAAYLIEYFFRPSSKPVAERVRAAATDPAK